MNASSMTVQEYRAQLDEHKEVALGYNGDPSEDKAQSSGVTNSVATTLSISMDQITHSDASAADYLSLAACVDRKDISVDLLEAASPQRREDAIKVLDRYALVTRRPAESALDVHRLVHQALRKRLQVQGRLQHWTQHSITQLLRVFPDFDHGSRSKWRRLLPHAKHALSHSLAKPEGGDRLTLVQKCALTLYSDGRYNEAEELFVQVMETSSMVLGKEHPVTLTSISNLASTYREQGRWKEAEELEVQVMETRKRVLGDEHPDTLTSMANLAYTLESQSRHKEARALIDLCFQSRRKVLGEQHPATQSSLRALNSWRGEAHEE
jgi:tetratricopeptide (TPR) repeat protein